MQIKCIIPLKETFILIRTKLNSRNYEGKTAVAGTWVDNAMDAIVKVHIDTVHLNLMCG